MSIVDIGVGLYYICGILQPNSDIFYSAQHEKVGKKKKRLAKKNGHNIDAKSIISFQSVHCIIQTLLSSICGQTS